MSKKDKQRINSLVEEGKITKQEAEKLLAALREREQMETSPWPKIKRPVHEREEVNLNLSSSSIDTIGTGNTVQLKEKYLKSTQSRSGGKIDGFAMAGFLFGLVPGGWILAELFVLMGNGQPRQFEFFDIPIPMIAVLCAIISIVSSTHGLYRIKYTYNLSGVGLARAGRVMSVTTLSILMIVILIVGFKR